MTIIVIRDDAMFQTELTNAASKLVVVDFFATWCGPCHRIAPFFEELSHNYPRVVFLKVDVEQCQETASSQGVTAMPTFIFYRNRVKVGQIKGTDPQALENKVRDLAGNQNDDDSEGNVEGHSDVLPFLNKSTCECLNDADDHPFSGCLAASNDYLESDVDEQLIISLGFHQSLKLHSLKMMAPQENGPKVLKLFLNHPRTLDFDQADKMEPVQTLELQPKDLSDGNPVNLRYVKFQNVQNLQIFVKENQNGAETTRIDQLVIYGSPVSTTKMGEFKRVAGKKGESH